MVTADAIRKVLERGEKLDDLQDESDALSVSSKAFYTSSKKQNASWFDNPLGWFTGPSMKNSQISEGNNSAVTISQPLSDAAPKPASNVRLESVEDIGFVIDESDVEAAAGLAALRMAEEMEASEGEAGPFSGYAQVDEVDTLLKDWTVIFDRGCK